MPVQLHRAGSEAERFAPQSWCSSTKAPGSVARMTSEPPGRGGNDTAREAPTGPAGPRVAARVTSSVPRSGRTIDTVRQEGTATAISRLISVSRAASRSPSSGSPPSIRSCSANAAVTGTGVLLTAVLRGGSIARSLWPGDEPESRSSEQEPEVKGGGKLAHTVGASPPRRRRPYAVRAGRARMLTGHPFSRPSRPARAAAGVDAPGARLPRPAAGRSLRDLHMLRLAHRPKPVERLLGAGARPAHEDPEALVDDRAVVSASWSRTDSRCDWARISALRTNTAAGRANSSPIRMARQTPQHVRAYSAAVRAPSTAATSQRG